MVVCAGAAPARIGRFEIKAVLGEGAFGVVYRGFDAELGRDEIGRASCRERV